MNRLVKWRRDRQEGLFVLVLPVFTTADQALSHHNRFVKACMDFNLTIGNMSAGYIEVMGKNKNLDEFKKRMGV